MTNQQLKLMENVNESKRIGEEVRHNQQVEEQNRKNSVRNTVSNVIGAAGSFLGPIGRVASSLISKAIKGPEEHVTTTEIISKDPTTGESTKTTDKKTVYSKNQKDNKEMKSLKSKLKVKSSKSGGKK